MSENIISLLGDKADSLLNHQPKISKDLLHLPGPDFVDRIFASTNRNQRVLNNLNWNCWANSTAFSFMSRVLVVLLTFSDVMEVNPYRLVFVSHYSVNQIIIKNGGRSKHLAPNGD